MKSRISALSRARQVASRYTQRATRNSPPAILLLLSLLIGLYAAQPLVGRRIAEGADTLLHLFRVVQVDALWEQGILFSRWSPDLAYGYGYPLFNYYAPLSYYLAELFHLAGLSLPAAFVATFVLIFLGASAAAFLWTRELLGATAALVSAAAYALSPYLMINLLHRGALAESLALALMPLIFWLVYRAVIHRLWRYRLATVLFFAALLLTHNISALILTPILAAYILLLDFARSSPDDQAILSRGSVILSDLWLLVLAILLTAWYWLPALGEQSLVQISQTFGPDDFRYENNFLSLGELFSGPFFLDVRLGNQAFPHALNLLVLFLAIIGSSSLVSRSLVDRSLASRSLANRPLRRIDRLHIWFAALISLACSLLMLEISTPIWDALPLIKFLQFPWRFLGIVTLLLSLLAGYGVLQLGYWLKNRVPITSLMAAAAVFVLALYIIPWTFVERLEPIEKVSMADSVAHELESGALGTTSAGEYLPVRVRQLPDEAQIQAARRPERLETTSLPAGAAVVEAVYTPLNYRIVIDSPEPFSALFNTFFFEGWEATIDGMEATIKPDASSGLIGLDVPAGLHTLKLHFNSTPLRRLAIAISLTGLALVAGTLIAGRRRKKPTGRSRSQELGVPGLLVISVLAALLAAVLIRHFYLETYAPANSRYDGAVVAGAGTPLALNFDDRLALIGMDSPAGIVAADELELTFFWRATVPIKEDHSVSVVLLDGEGNVFGQSDNQHIGDAPTSHWRLGKYTADEHRMALLPGAPPGEYDVTVTVYKYGRPGERLDILDELGNPIGQSRQVGRITMGRPLRPASTSTFDLPNALNVPIANGVRLVGYQVAQDSLWAGETIGLDLYWKAEQEPGADLATGFWLRHAGGETVSAGHIPPVPTFPTSLWEAGDLWLGRHNVAVPPSLLEGNYTLLLGDEEENAVEIATIAVSVPEHRMEPPEAAFHQDEQFGDVARLSGYDAPPASAAATSLAVTLHWQSLGQTRENYRSFVQLLDEDGHFVAGSDQVPGAWQRPTTGWVEGEYVDDMHTLELPADLPPGLYHLSAGLYDAATSQRLLTPAGHDSAIFETPLAIAKE